MLKGSDQTKLIATYFGGAFDQGPTDIYSPGYNMSYLELQKQRPGYTFIDPVTGEEKAYEKVYVGQYDKAWTKTYEKIYETNYQQDYQSVWTEQYLKAYENEFTTNYEF